MQTLEKRLTVLGKKLGLTGCGGYVDILTTFGYLSPDDILRLGLYDPSKPLPRRVRVEVLKIERVQPRWGPGLRVMLEAWDKEAARLRAGGERAAQQSDQASEVDNDIDD